MSRETLKDMLKSGYLGLASAQGDWQNGWTDSAWTEPTGDTDLKASTQVTEQQKPDFKLSIEFMTSLESAPSGKVIEYSDKVYVFTLPFLGRLHILQEKVGFFTVGFIILYWTFGTWSTIWALLIPHYNQGDVNSLPIICYIVISILCITSLFRAVTSNPGRIPFPQSTNPVVTDLPPELYCSTCHCQRPRKSHHCRRCGQCILRMDHHCPWINNCVGEENHYLFVQLIIYAFLMGLGTMTTCFLHIYYWTPCESCVKVSFVLETLTTLVGVCIVLVAGGLLMMAHVSLLRDMTTIDWLKLNMEISARKSFSFKDIPGRKKTTMEGLNDMCGPGPRFLWPFPCRRRPRTYTVIHTEIV